MLKGSTSTFTSRVNIDLKSLALKFRPRVEVASVQLYIDSTLRLKNVEIGSAATLQFQIYCISLPRPNSDSKSDKLGSNYGCGLYSIATCQQMTISAQVSSAAGIDTSVIISLVSIRHLRHCQKRKHIFEKKESFPLKRLTKRNKIK